MSAPVEYLYAKRRNELARELAAQGFDVAVQPSGQDEGFDLTASKGNSKRAFTFKTIADLKDSLDHVRHLRKRARELGYDAFELIVVSPPRPIAVHVDSLEEELLYHLPPDLPQRIKDITHWDAAIKEVSHLQLDKVDVTPGGIHVSGSGLVSVVFHAWGAPPGEEPPTDEFPMHFDVQLDGNRRIQPGHAIRVDISSLNE